MATATAARRAPVSPRLRRLAADGVRVTAEDDLLTAASAIAFRVLIALIPLTLLALGLLGATGQSRVWHSTIGPSIRARVTPAVYSGIDETAQRIFHSSGLGLIAFATALAIWDVSGAVRACMGALSRIAGCEETRSTRRKLAVSVALAAGFSVAVIGALLALLVAPNLIRHGAVHWLIAIGRWPMAILLLGAAVALLVRFGPAENRRTRRATVGSALIIGAWLIATYLFKLYVEYVASFTSAPGILVAFLVLTTYVYVTSLIFLAGVEVDEQLPHDANGVIDIVRAVGARWGSR